MVGAATVIPVARATTIHLPLVARLFRENSRQNLVMAAKCPAIIGQRFDDKYDLIMVVIDERERRGQADRYQPERLRSNSA